MNPEIQRSIDTIEAIKTRIAELKLWFKEDRWFNPWCSSTTNGYNAARREELVFLENLLIDPNRR
jgi:hypothetical protein